MLFLQKVKGFLVGVFRQYTAFMSRNRIVSALKLSCIGNAELNPRKFHSKRKVGFATKWNFNRADRTTFF